MKILAQGISVLFHPLYIILYFFGLMILVNPYQFSGFQHEDMVVFFISLFMLSCIIPMIAVLMMYFLGFMQGGLEMSDSKDRIGPLIVTGICYCWLFINFFNSSYVPIILTIFMLGATIGLFITFLMNLFQKVSLHMVGLGGLIAGSITLVFGGGYGSFEIILLNQIFNINLVLLLMLIVLITGLVASARLYLKAHVTHEIYGGFIIGFISQILAFRILY